MANKPPSTFHYRGLTFIQSTTTHRITTDSLILGNYAHSIHGHLLDVGAATGIIGLLAASQHLTEVKSITAIEQDSHSIPDLQTNYHTNLPHLTKYLIHQNLLTLVPPRPYHTILCNPPYHEGGHITSPKALTRQRYFHIHQWLSALQALLAPRGTIQLILPSHLSSPWIQAALTIGLRYTHHHQLHSPSSHQAKSRSLLTFTHHHIPFAQQHTPDYHTALSHIKYQSSNV